VTDATEVAALLEDGIEPGQAPHLGGAGEALGMAEVSQASP
jgi:hypothetical protein